MPKFKKKKRDIPHKYRSNSEYNMACVLEENNIAYEYETFKISYEWKEDKKYIPDFILPNGIILEVKGRFMLEDRKKHLFIRKEFPELDIRFVFDNPNNKLNKGAKSTYADWCIKNDFLFCRNSDHDVIKKWSDEQRSTRRRRRRDVSDKRRTTNRKQTDKSREGSISKRNSTSTSRRNKTGNTKRARGRKTS